MNSNDFLRLGVPLGEATRPATDFVAQYVLHSGDTAKLEDEITAIVTNPALFAEDPLRRGFARVLLSTPHSDPLPGRGGEGGVDGARRMPVKHRQWGGGLESNAVTQTEN